MGAEPRLQRAPVRGSRVSSREASTFHPCWRHALVCRVRRSRPPLTLVVERTKPGHAYGGLCCTSFRAGASAQRALCTLGFMHFVHMVLVCLALDCTNLGASALPRKFLRLVLLHC